MSLTEPPMGRPQTTKEETHKSTFSSDRQAAATI